MPATTLPDTRAWRLSDEASLRDEPFGALAYHHRTRRLVFLKSPHLVRFVRELGQFATLADALAQVDEAQRPAFRRALDTLIGAEVLCVA